MPTGDFWGSLFGTIGQEIGKETEANRQYRLKKRTAGIMSPLEEASLSKTQAETKKLTAEASAREKGFGDLIGLLGGNQGGSLPRGSKVKVNPITGEYDITLDANPEYTRDESTLVATTPEIRGSVERAKSIVSGTGASTALASKLPEWLSGGISAVIPGKTVDLEVKRGQALRQSVQQLTSLIPFAFGGKQLTITEKKAVTDLLAVVGKSDKRISEDYERFARIFETMSDLTQRGLAASTTMSEILKQHGIALKGLEEELKLPSSKSRTIDNGSGRRGGKEMVDANGNRAIVYPDGTFEEIQ